MVGKNINFSNTNSRQQIQQLYIEHNLTPKKKKKLNQHTRY